MSALDRRTFILGGVASAGIAAVGARAKAADQLDGDPFTLGVASGDPVPGGIVLWTRLAPYPQSANGHGGMPKRNVDVQWQVALDPQFSQVVASGTVVARHHYAHSVHVEVNGLNRSREYFYRFRTLDSNRYLSPVGRFRTAPPHGTAIDRLTFAVASCAHFEQGYFHAYQGIAESNPDLVIFLGDYIYEKGSHDPEFKRIVRPYTNGDNEADNLAEYRLQYADHRSDPKLQAAHQAAPWLPVLDDHEVDNNWTAANSKSAPMNRKVQAFRAWYENMPVRWAQRPRGASGIQIYRRRYWGSLARFDMLDTRQYRDPQGKSCDAYTDTTRTITGNEQKQWLLNGFRDHGATWNFLGQQVFFSKRLIHDPPEAECDIANDAWDGYQAERHELVQGWANRGLPNPVVLTGDVHKHYAANVHVNYDGDDPVGAELVTSSVTSGGSNGKAPVEQLEANPHIKYVAAKRGYIMCTVTPNVMEADFMAIRDVTDPVYSYGTQVSLDARFVGEAGDPGLYRA